MRMETFIQNRKNAFRAEVYKGSVRVAVFHGRTMADVVFVANRYMAANR